MKAMLLLVMLLSVSANALSMAEYFEMNIEAGMEEAELISQAITKLNGERGPVGTLREHIETLNAATLRMRSEVYDLYGMTPAAVTRYFQKNKDFIEPYLVTNPDVKARIAAIEGSIDKADAQLQDLLSKEGLR